MCLSLERVVRVRALAGDIVLYSWARHLTLTVPLSTQVYKWVPVNCWGNLTNCGGMTCDGLASRPGGVEILLACFMLQKLGISYGSYEPVGSKASFFFYQSSSIELIFLEKISEDKFLKMDDAFHLDTSLIVSYNYNEFE